MKQRETIEPIPPRTPPSTVRKYGVHLCEGSSFRLMIYIDPRILSFALTDRRANT